PASTGPFAVVIFGGLALACASGLQALSSPHRSVAGRPAAFNRLFVESVAALPLRWLSPQIASGKVEGRSFRPFAGQTVPIFMSVASADVIGSTQSLSVTIRVDAVGDSIQIGTD